MALGGNVLRQHVVEFIRGTGIVTDGVVDATSLNGPWSWTVPDGVAELILDGCGAGGGGAGGQNTGAARGGGGGGTSGLSLNGFRLPVVPGSALTIAVGAAGLGGSPGANDAQQAGTNGGATTVSGLTRAPLALFAGVGYQDSTFTIPGGSRGGGNNTLGNGGFGSIHGLLGLPSATSVSPPVAAATPATGSLSGEISDPRLLAAFGCAVYGHAGSPGGAASTSPTTNGSGGATWRTTGGRALSAMWSFQGATSGTNDGSVSYGGGGGGAPSLYGVPGNPGNGNAAATAGQGFGFGGSGGGGNAPGTPGGDGYLRFTYWSMD